MFQTIFTWVYSLFYGVPEEPPPPPDSASTAVYKWLTKDVPVSFQYGDLFINLEPFYLVFISAFIGSLTASLVIQLIQFARSFKKDENGKDEKIDKNEDFQSFMRLTKSWLKRTIEESNDPELMSKYQSSLLNTWVQSFSLDKKSKPEFTEDMDADVLFQGRFSQCQSKEVQVEDQDDSGSSNVAEKPNLRPGKYFSNQYFPITTTKSPENIMKPETYIDQCLETLERNMTEQYKQEENIEERKKTFTVYTPTKRSLIPLAIKEESPKRTGSNETYTMSRPSLIHPPEIEFADPNPPTFYVNTPQGVKTLYHPKSEIQSSTQQQSKTVGKPRIPVSIGKYRKKTVNTLINE